MPSKTTPSFVGLLAPKKDSECGTPADQAIAANGAAGPQACSRPLTVESDGGFSPSDMLGGFESLVLRAVEEDDDSDDGRGNAAVKRGCRAPTISGAAAAAASHHHSLHSPHPYYPHDNGSAAAAAAGCALASGDARGAAADHAHPLHIHQFPVVLPVSGGGSAANSPLATGRSSSSAGPRAAMTHDCGGGGSSHMSGAPNLNASTSSANLGRPPAYTSVTSMASGSSMAASGNGGFPQFLNSSSASTAVTSHWGSLAGAPGAAIMIGPGGNLVAAPHAVLAAGGTAPPTTALFPVPSSNTHTVPTLAYPHSASAAPLGIPPGLPTSKSGDTLSDEQVKSNLFVRNLPLTVSDKDLRAVFGEYGHIESAKVMLNIHSGESRGIAFVKFDDSAAADRALRALNDSTAFGGTQPLIVRIANSKAAYLPGAPTNKTFVRNVPVELSKQELIEFFSQFGTVVDISIHADTAGENAAAAAAAAAAGLVLPSARPANGAATGGGSNGTSLAADGHPSPSVPGGEGETHPDGERKLNIVFVTFAEKESAQKAADAIHTTMPFKECRGVLLLAKVAEDNARRMERLHRKYNRGNNSSTTSSLGMGAGGSTTLPMMGTSLAGAGLPGFASFPGGSSPPVMLAAGGMGGGMPLAGYYPDASAAAAAAAMSGSKFPGVPAASPIALPQMGAASFLAPGTAATLLPPTSSNVITTGIPPGMMSMGMPTGANTSAAFFMNPQPQHQQHQQHQAMIAAAVAAANGQSLGGTHLPPSTSQASLTGITPPQPALSAGSQAASATSGGQPILLTAEQQHQQHMRLQLFVQQQHQIQQLFQQQQLQLQILLQQQQQPPQSHMPTPASTSGFGAQQPQMPTFAAYTLNTQQAGPS